MFQWGSEYLSKKSGICPMCHTFIAKNSSRVKNIPRPLAPRIKAYEWESGYYCADTGKPWYFDARHPGQRKRWTVHSRCYAKALARIDEEYGTDFKAA